MKVVELILATLLLLNGVNTFAQNKLNSYSYDDDNSDVNFALMSDNPNQIAAMHFNVGEKEQMLKTIKIYVSGGKIEGVDASIHIILLDKDNKEYITPFKPITTKEWNTVLIEENIIIKGNIMVGVEWITPTGTKEPFSSFFIGADLNVSNHNGYIKHLGGDYYPARRFGSSGAKNFYIRVEAEEI